MCFLAVLALVTITIIPILHSNMTKNGIILYQAKSNHIQTVVGKIYWYLLGLQITPVSLLANAILKIPNVKKMRVLKIRKNIGMDAITM